MSGIRCDVRLSCGLVVTHRRLANGATAAVPADGSDVPSHRDWWPEYCEVIKAGVPDRSERPEDSGWEFGAPAPSVGPVFQVQALRGPGWTETKDPNSP